MADLQTLLQPFQIKQTVFRNRLMSTSHAPSYGEKGMPADRYQLYHLEKAKGGIGLTMFGGSASVAIDSPARPWNQIDLSRDDVIPYLQQFSGRVHEAGAKLMCQITHMGRRARWDVGDWMPVISSSPVQEPSHRSFPKEMEDFEIRRVIAAYGAAARRCFEGGLDGLEVLVDTHMPAQFLSPAINRRTDEWGGDLERRMRFLLEVLAAIRSNVGDDFLVGVRMSGDEMQQGGNEPADILRVVHRLWDGAYVDFFNVQGGNGYTERMLAATVVPSMAYPPALFLHLASAIRRETGAPVFQATRINDVVTAARAVADGHVDLVGMTRAHIADPHIGNKLREGRADDIRQCVGAGYCIDRIYTGGDAVCIQNVATGREGWLSHTLPDLKRGRRVVVVGAGPAGMEAARVCASLGDTVTLFERDAVTGGQIRLFAKDWREPMTGIVRWLDQQVRKLGVDLRLETEATRDAVLALNPDVVIIATGGDPVLGPIEGAREHAVSTVDILSGKVERGANVLVYDDHADHHAPGCASYMASRGSLVEVVTPERRLLTDVGNTNTPVHLRELYNHGVVITPDMRLISVAPEGNQLVAVLRNEYTDAEEERLVDQVVIDHGTAPRDELYFALKPYSRNRGEVDLVAFAHAGPQTIETNPDGAFRLFRIGDAVATRNIHAGLLDAMRIGRGL